MHTAVFRQDAHAARRTSKAKEDSKGGAMPGVRPKS
jgi:hypothetical protein